MDFINYRSSHNSLRMQKKTQLLGRVYNPVTNEGISGVKVYVGKQKNGVPGSVDGQGSKLLASTETDNSGNFYLNEKLSKNKTYNFRFNYDEEKYFAIEGYSSTVSFSNDNQAINWPLVPTAYIRKKIKNINCFNSDDKIEIYACDDFGVIPCNTAYTLIGCSDVENTDFLKTISGTIKYHWIVTKNNIVTHHYDTIYLAPFEERYYEILY